MSVYLDYNSSAPIKQMVLSRMIQVYENAIGNADSRTHDFGENARKVVEEARSQFADLLKVRKDEVFFTSGATESNNIAIQGLKEYALKSGKKHIITSSIEHKAVLETAKHMRDEGFEVSFIDPEYTGRISASQVADALRPDTLLVSLMHVNNETGIIQPVNEVGDYLSDKDVLFHIDATQSFGKLVDELRSTKYNMLSMSAHKIGGPQGVGALVLKKQGYKLPPVKNVFYGGQQEHGIRPGTIPVALVAGLGEACRIASKEYHENSRKTALLKSLLFELLAASGVIFEFNGDQDFCVSSTANVYFRGVSSEALMLSSKQYCGVSNGSACNSNSYKPSYVLTAMGYSAERAESSIRISWGPETDPELFQEAINNLLNTVKNFQG